MTECNQQPTTNNQQPTTNNPQPTTKGYKTMRTIHELRKAIKPLGYNVKTRSLSWGKHATYFHIATKKECSANVFTPDQYALWKPLFDWRKANNAALKELRGLTDIRGLV